MGLSFKDGVWEHYSRGGDLLVGREGFRLEWAKKME